MYRAPIDEISHTLKHVAGLGSALQSGQLGDLSEDLVDAILEEAGRFANEEITPAGRRGDSAVFQHGTNPIANLTQWRYFFICEASRLFQNGIDQIF